MKRPTHVLIVDDNVDTRTVLRVFLEIEGMIVTEASDGLEGLERLAEVRQRDAAAPSVILLDWMMPRCSGDEFRRRQLANATTADVPIVVISAAAEREDVFRDLNPSAIVAKPFQLEDVLHAVYAVLPVP